MTDLEFEEDLIAEKAPLQADSLVLNIHGF